MNNGSLEVNFLNIGQGDAAYIKFPDGQNLVLDTGPTKYTVNQIDKKKSFFDKGIQNILLTHPDNDHVAGTENILKEYKVKNLFLAKNQDYKIKFGGNIYNVMSGDSIKFDKYIFKIFNPYSQTENQETNHNSIVSVLDDGNISFLFMADADKEIERKILSSGQLGYLKDQILIYKVGHHGSNTSSSDVFLKALQPEYCVISVGAHNSYGHPKPEVLETLNKYCGQVYRTDSDGTVTFDTDGESLQISFK